MAEATNPITTASNPRVGKPPFAQWRDELFAAGRELQNPAAAKEAFQAGYAAALASAPSPEAGAGGDLGELEKLSAAATQGDIIAEPYTDDHGGCYLMAGEIQIAAGLTEEDGAYLAALARDHRSGKLVASTGSGFNIPSPGQGEV